MGIREDLVDGFESSNRLELIYLKKKIKSLYRNIAHGDKEHRKWLKNKINKHFKEVI